MGKKYINTPYKIYFEDTGLRNARLNFRQIENTHLMENIIYNELRYRGYNVDVGIVEGREKNKVGQSVRKQFEIVEKSMKPRRTESGYVIMGAREFLLDENSLEA